LREISLPPAPAEIIDQDRSYVLKKLGLSELDFEKIFESPKKTHRDYPNNSKLWNHFSYFVQWARKRITRVG
jgi:hypothetical protein